MMTNRAQQNLRLFGLAIVAALFSGTPIPYWMDLIRPELLLLIVLWLTLHNEKHNVLTIAWIAGLTMDAFHGSILGENALGYVAIAYLMRRYYQRIRAFPTLHQTLVIFVFLVIEEFIVFWIDGLTGRPLTIWTRWLETVSTAALWPWACRYIPIWIKRPML